MPRQDSALAERVMVQVRLPKDLVRRIDHLSIDRDLFRAQMVEHLVREGLKTFDHGESSGVTGGT